MPPRKTYVPRCPESHCPSLTGPKLRRVTAEEINMPEEVSVPKDARDRYVCGDCGFVWFQKRRSPPGFGPTPAGYYREGKFTPDVSGILIRQENTPAYYKRRRAAPKARIKLSKSLTRRGR